MVIGSVLFIARALPRLQEDKFSVQLLYNEIHVNDNNSGLWKDKKTKRLWISLKPHLTSTILK